MTAVERLVASGATELDEFQSAQMLHRVLVRARCFSVSCERGRRYELVVEAHGQTAVVDLKDPLQIECVRDATMAVFASAVAVRARVSPTGLH